MSPMTTVLLPIRLNEAHDVRPIGGVIRTPATLMSRSARGTDTLKTPSSSSFPLAPVSSSIRAVSGRVVSWAGAPAALETAAIKMNAGASNAAFMVPPLGLLRNNIENTNLGLLGSMVRHRDEEPLAFRNEERGSGSRRRRDPGDHTEPTEVRRLQHIDESCSARDVQSFAPRVVEHIMGVTIDGYCF